ncbi:MAG: TenA family transcriptional regulator [Thermoproteus sp.]
MAGVIARLRAEIAGLNERVFASPVLRNPDLDSVKRFIANQLYIVPHDLKALSAAMAKARSDDEISFVKSLVDGDYAAARALAEMAKELGVSFRWEALDPYAVAYTHFLSWLALNGTMGDLAVAMTVNLPVWGEACARLSSWLKANGFRSTGFLDLFSGPYDEMEKAAESIAERYYDYPRYLFIARAIQSYECSFWFSISGSNPGECRRAVA